MNRDNIDAKRKKVLLFDNCLIGVCNMHCKYCRSGSIEYIGKDRVKTGNDTVDLKELAQDLKNISLLANRVFDIPIMKISGYGEAFILKNIVDVLNRISGPYERIQLITNATLLDENLIAAIAKIPGINVCVSLDGHTAKLNASRITDARLIKKILLNIDLMRKYGIAVEINSVLTKYNISGFVDFVDYLSQRYDRLTCYPFPVRGHENLVALGQKNAQKIMPLLDYYQRLCHVLPPKAYLKRLISFVGDRGRKDVCYVGYANLGLLPNGNIPVCACSIKHSLGNIFDKDIKSILKKSRLSAKEYRFFVRNIFGRNCVNCFTHYEVVNLYLDGTISLNEISSIPLFGGKRTQETLAYLKKQLI